MKIEFPKYFSDGEITLTKLELSFDNAKKLYDVIDHNREHLWIMPWTDKTTKPEVTYEWLQSIQPSSSGAYVIMIGDDIVGSIVCVRYSGEDSPNKNAEIGYWLSKDFVGRGIVSRALKILEKFLFEAGFNRLEIHMDTKNKASENAAIRNEYRKEGELREDRVNPGGGMRNTFIYSKLRSEFK